MHMPRRAYGNKAKEPIFRYLEQVEDLTTVTFAEIARATKFSELTAKKYFCEYCTEHCIQIGEKPKGKRTIPLEVWNEWDKTVGMFRGCKGLDVPIVKRA